MGFLYTILVYRGGSLWPCILSHVFVNASSVFAAEQGPFTRLVRSVLADQAADAVLTILVSAGYAWWIAAQHEKECA